MSLVMVVTGFQPANAQSDEQWLPTSIPDPGYHSATVQERPNFFRTFPRLETNVNGKNVSCEGIDSGKCKGGRGYSYNANYPVCDEATQRDCISKFSITRDNRQTFAEFVSYVYPGHPGDFEGDGKGVMKRVETASIWTIPEEPHAYGDKYVVLAGQEGGFGRDYVNVANYAEIFAVELVPVDCPDCINSCKDGGCGGFAYDRLEGLNCLFVTSDGFCTLHRPLPENVQLSLEVRSGIKPGGWFHGRMAKPNIEVGSFGNQMLLTISAEPVRVPILHFPSTNYPDLPSQLKRYWDTCRLDFSCPMGTRIAFSDPWNIKDGRKRQIDSEFSPVGENTLKAVSIIAPHVKDTAVAAPRYWSYRTIEKPSWDTTSCYARAKGVQGIVTTNSVAYEDGAPKYSGGFLNYKVAGLHYLPDGTEALGSYDLVMRSDLARCLYGFSKAPVSGTITITGEGDKTIATTTVGEKNGWLKLSAQGFTFSEKTIKVKLTQKKQTTFTCIAIGKKTKKVTAVNPKCPEGYKKR